MIEPFRPMQILHQLLIFGLLLVMSCIAMGGIIYLLNHGMDTYISHGMSSREIKNLPGSALMEVGLYLLVSLQLIRVFAVAILFLLEKEIPFFGMTLFVLAILFFSLFFGLFQS